MTSALAPVSALFSDRETGQDARSANIAAVKAVANVLKSSLGPLGLDKLLVDDIGDVTITNDGATILKKFEIQHPAARVLVELSQLQDQEVGDGTTSVVLIASELLQRANRLIQNGIHPVAVIAGYKTAMKESLAYIQKHLVTSVDTMGKSLLLNVAETTLSSKYIGAEAKHFSNIVVDAVLGVHTVNDAGESKYPVKAINICQGHGRSAKESFLCDGYTLPRTSRASVGMPQLIKKAKIALLDFNLRQHRMQIGIQIEITNPLELEKIREKERDITKSKIQKILDAGANVILTTQGIDDMALKYFVEAKCIAIRRVNKQDLRRIARCTGGTICLTMSTLEGDESFNSEWLGECKEVSEERVGDWDFIFFKGCRTSKAMSIVLRGPNELFLDEMQRSMHDAICAVSRTCEHNSICAGGGAMETALSVYLDDFALILGTQQQLPIAEFAEALLIIPKTLAINAAHDCLELLGNLRKVHYMYQQQLVKSDDSKWSGLNLITGTVQNNVQAGIVEPAISKIKMIRFATEAAITLLRIDDVIKITKDDTEVDDRRQ